MPVAFDLDGCIVADLNYNEVDVNNDEEGKEKLLDIQHNAMMPIFQPGKILNNFYVLTGRNVKYKKDTIKWMKRYFKIQPSKMFHENKNGFITSMEYKLSVLEQNKDISLFIESDRVAVKYLQTHLSSKRLRSLNILHFQTYIENHMYADFYRY